MPPKKPNPRRVAAAVRDILAGIPSREVGAKYGASYVTVLRWVQAHKKKQAEEAEAEEAAAPAPWTGLTKSLIERDAPPLPSAEEDEPEAGSTLDHVRKMQRSMIKLARDSQAVGNMKAAQAALRDAGALANTIARLERTEAEGGDMVKFSRAALAEAEGRVRDYATTILSRGACRCADCSRALSVTWGEEAKARKAEDPGAPPVG